MPSAPLTRPIDATLSVTKAARLLGVHPNTVRAWSDAGRLRYYRINPRGDRRYRLGDLQRFLAAAENSPELGPGIATATSPGGRRGAGSSANADRGIDGRPVPTDRERLRRRADLATITALARIAADPETVDEVLRQATLVIRERGAFRSVAIHELRADRLVPRATNPTGHGRHPDLPRAYGSMGAALARAASADPGPVAGDGFGGLGDGVGGIREVSIAIPGEDGPWGVLTIGADPDGDQTAIDPDLLIELAVATGVIVEAAERVDEVAHRLHRADALRRVASDIGSRLDLDRILSGLVDHAMVLFTAIARRCSCAARRTGQRGGQPWPVGALPDAVGRLPDAIPAVDGGGRATAALRNRLPRRSARQRRPGRSHPGGFRHALHGAPLRPHELLGLLNVYHDTPHDLDRATSSTRWPPSRPGGDRDQERPELREAGHLGRPAPVDPAARRAPRRLASVAEIGQRDRDRAPPAHRLPQRPGLPPPRRGPDPGRHAGPGRRVRRRDARAAGGQVRPGHHRLGRGAPARAEPAGRRGRPPGEHDRGDRRRPRRIDAPRADDSTRTRSSASSSSRSSASTSSPTTTFGSS